MTGTCSLPMVHSKNKRRQLGSCIESVLDLSLLNIFSNDNGTGSVFTTWPETLKLREATGTSEDKLKLIMVLTKQRNAKQ